MSHEKIIDKMFQKFKEYNLSLKDLIQIYGDSFGYEDETYKFLKHIIDNKEYYDGTFDNITKQYIYGMVWSDIENEKGVDLLEHYHATVVIQCYDDDVDKKFYILISHELKGHNIFSFHYTFPYKRSDKINDKHSPIIDNELKKKYYYYGYPNNKVLGGIMCQGKINKSVYKILYYVMVWWFMNDVQGGATKTRFPASCTGLTETILYKAAPKLYNNCPKFKLDSQSRKMIKAGNYPKYKRIF